MNKGKIQRVLFLGLILFMTACSQTQPTAKVQLNAIEEVATIEKVESIAIVEKTKELIPEINKETQRLSLTTLTSELISEKQNESWTPFKVEDEIEWNAKELLGKKYVWGATGPNTYDCSGFTQKIYDDLGIKLPRVSRDQAKRGKLLKFNELKKGDLVFFHTNKRKPNRVTHVGIYLGNNNFIHASSGAKKIVICNFKKDQFYRKTFSWGRRVIEPKQHIATMQEPIQLSKKSL